MTKIPLPEIATVWRLLTFRISANDLRSLSYRHLALGLLLTWVVGMGRWWEDPKANWIQHLGIGSLVYVVALSLFLWLLLWPLDAPHWSYVNILTFITLTSPPAILYALPVRHGLDVDTAQAVRLWLLAIVAGWRVGLLGLYLWRGAGFGGFRWLVATLVPILVIVVALFALNLEKVVFDFMGGIRETDKSVNDAAYGILFLIAALSYYASIPVFLAYLGVGIDGLVRRFRRRSGH